MLSHSAQPIRTTRTAAHWPTWPYFTVLTILFLGPPAAALCIASGISFFVSLGWTAHSVLSTYVCPTPLKTYELLGAPMAVCARCWGATIGLWVGWYLSARATPQSPISRYYGLHVATRFLMSLAPFGLWWLEIRFWPTASYELLLVNGMFAGMTAGMFFCSIWPGLLRRS